MTRGDGRRGARGPRRGRAPVPLLAAALLAIGAGPAAAHDLWLEPSSFHPAPGAPFGVRLRVGERLEGEAAGRDPAVLVRLDLETARATTSLVGAEGADPAGVGRTGAAGWATVVYVAGPRTIVLDARTFERYLREEEHAEALRIRAEAGEADREGRERYGRCAKALLDVGGADGGVVHRPAGCALEIVPDAAPPRVASASPWSVRVLWQGKPLAGVRVGAVSAAAKDDGRWARTDGDGRVAFPLDRAGTWLLRTVRLTRAESGDDVEWRSEWSSLVLEVGP